MCKEAKAAEDAVQKAILEDDADKRQTMMLSASTSFFRAFGELNDRVAEGEKSHQEIKDLITEVRDRKGWFIRNWDERPKMMVFVGVLVALWIGAISHDDVLALASLLKVF